MSARCAVWSLGCVPYAEAWALQKALANPDDPDRLLLLSHPHTYTMGSRADPAHLLWDADERARRGIALYPVDRGGDVTYHGPGQLVAYPILRLDRAGGVRLGVVDYLRRLEAVIIGTLVEYGIAAFTLPGLTGVWAHGADGAAVKVAAIGVRVTVKMVTQHGCAVNLNTDMGYFEGIIPCGIRDHGVTSLVLLTGAPVDEAQFAARFTDHFGQQFARTMIAEAPGVWVRRCP